MKTQFLLISLALVQFSCGPAPQQAPSLTEAGSSMDSVAEKNPVANCIRREVVNDSNYDPEIIDSCHYKNISAVSFGTADYKGRYSYGYTLFLQNRSVKNHEIINENLAELEDLLNRDVRAEYDDMLPHSESCFEGFSLPSYKIDDFGIAFDDSCMVFNLSFGLPGACMAFDGVSVRYKLKDIEKYLK
mgnify:CR=1 FL=1